MIGNLTLIPSSQIFKEIISGHFSTILNLISSVLSPLDKPFSNQQKSNKNKNDSSLHETNSSSIEGAAAATATPVSIPPSIFSHLLLCIDTLKGKRHRSLPPSLCLSKQPVKPLQRALRGIPNADVTQLLCCGGDLLTSEVARINLNLAAAEELASSNQGILKHHSSLNQDHFTDMLENE